MAVITIAADQTFSVNRKYFIVSCICAQKQYVDFRLITDCPPEGRSDVRVNCKDG